MGFSAALCAISKRRLPTETRFFLLKFVLWGGQLADHEEISDECDHFCFGLGLGLADATFKLTKSK